MNRVISSFEELYDLHHNGERVGEAVVDAVTDAIARSKTIRTAEIALLLDANEHELCAAWHLLTGMRLKDVIKQWRYCQALELVESGEYELKEVARRCGWRSVLVMDHIFSRYGNMTATGMRNSRAQE